MCFENHAFQVLAKAMADLPKYATHSLRRFPSLHDYYKKENGGEMFRTMTTVADELITEVLKDVTNKTPMNESNTSGYEENELETEAICGTQRSIRGHSEKENNLEVIINKE